MNILNKKRILITGITNNKSIAYGIANSMYKNGAELAFSYQSDKLEKRIKDIAEKFNSDICIKCDVLKKNNIKNLFENLSKKWVNFDGFIHSIAYAPLNEFGDDYIKSVTRSGFRISHEVSSYSFSSMAKNSIKMLNNNSSIIAITFLGSKRVIPNYNVMGLAKASLEANVRYMSYSLGNKNIRVNAISSGPIKTVASFSIKNFKKMQKFCESLSMIKRSVTIDEIGNVASFLCSDLSSGISGQIINVDGGLNISSFTNLNI